MPLTYLGVGLSRTGTKSLWKAMNRLGFNSRHWEPGRLADVVLGETKKPDFKRYDDCDFICDIPHAYFFREIWEAYPDVRFILTETDADNWYRSMCHHYRKDARREPVDLALHMMVYGGGNFYNLPEFLYKKRFLDWNLTVKQMIPASQLLVMNLRNGDGYAKLCPFVDRPVPANENFPHESKSGPSAYYKPSASPRPSSTSTGPRSSSDRAGAGPLP